MEWLLALDAQHEATQRQFLGSVLLIKLTLPQAGGPTGSDPTTPYMNPKTSWSCTKEEGRSEVEARTSEEESVVRITCRMLLRLEQCVEVPEAAQPRTHMD